MAKKIVLILLGLFVLLLAYLFFWPVPVDPVAWEAPLNPGYTGPFATNRHLQALEHLPIGDNTGPEDLAVDEQGRIYAATDQGRIVRLDPDGSNPVNWAETGGRPLGIEFDAQGNLIVADAFKGLLSVSPEGQVTVLAAEFEGRPIPYADDVDVALDGKIYFSDASTKFSAREWHGSLDASLMDLNEHGGHGRLLMYNPQNKKVALVLDGLNFANGVAISPDQSFVAVCETGSYRVMRYWLSGPKQGRAEPLIEGLPGFPDNISAGLEGRFWVALVSPRNKLLDSLSDSPFLRKVIPRLPKFIQPAPVAYGHVIAIDGQGKVLHDLQDPQGGYPQNTSVIELPDRLYLGSLTAPAIGRVMKSKIGLPLVVKTAEEATEEN